MECFSDLYMFGRSLLGVFSMECSTLFEVLEMGGMVIFYYSITFMLAILLSGCVLKILKIL